MAGKTKDIMEIRQIIQLLNKSYSKRKTAELLNVHRNTVNYYDKLFSEHALSYDELLSMDETSLRELFPEQSAVDQSRYEILSRYFLYFASQLKKPGCTLKTLWQEYKQSHPDGYQYAQFALHFKKWRKQNTGSSKLQHTAGEKLMIDFTGKKLAYVDADTGEISYAEVFVGILPASQLTFVIAIASQQIEDFITALAACLQFIGGVPQVIVPDNFKAAVTSNGKNGLIINKTLKDFALHYGCTIDPARPYKPQDKALVENAVNLVYQRIFYPLQHHTFFSLEEINKAITPLLASYNNYLFQRSHSSRREEFNSIEKHQLRPLPQEPYSIRYYKRLKVHPIGHIYLQADKHYYSVPYNYIGCQIEVQYTNQTVEIFARGSRIATHKRDPRPGKYSTLEEHRSKAHQAVYGWNRDEFREKAAKIGVYTEKYILRLIDQYNYPEHGYRQARGILKLARYYSAERLEKACKLVIDFRWCSHKTIADILKNGTDQNQIELFDAPERQMPDHYNKRGKDAFS